MDNFNAIGIAEGFVECGSEEEYLSAWQHLVDTGLAWSLQGSFGRTANQLIEDGLISANKQNNLISALKTLGKLEFIVVA